MDEHAFDGYLDRQTGHSELDWDGLRRFNANMARCAKHYFDCLLAEGFTPEYALRIICSHGCYPKLPPSTGTSGRTDEGD